MPTNQVNRLDWYVLIFIYLLFQVECRVAVSILDVCAQMWAATIRAMVALLWSSTCCCVIGVFISFTSILDIASEYISLCFDAIVERYKYHYYFIKNQPPV